MSRFAGALVACACLSLAGAAGAQKPPPPAKKGQAPGQQKMQMPTKPAVELEKLKFFEGNWNCDGTQMAGPMGPEHKFKARAKIERSLDGHWYAVRYEEQKSKEHPAFSTSEQWGWDAASGSYVRLMATSTGGWSVFHAPGWDNDKLVMTGEGAMMGEKSASRHAFTRKSDKEVTLLIEAQQQGQWKPWSQMTCKK